MLFSSKHKRLLGKLDAASISTAKQILLDCYRRRGRVYTVGNGGSASTAHHFACDLGKYVIPAGQRPFDVRCLTDNVSLYTAWANDADRNDVFVNQMHGLLTADDVVLAISVHGGSGFSADLVRAIRYAKKVGCARRSHWSDLTAASCIANAPAPFSCRWSRLRRLKQFMW